MTQHEGGARNPLLTSLPGGQCQCSPCLCEGVAFTNEAYAHLCGSSGLSAEHPGFSKDAVDARPLL